MSNTRSFRYWLPACLLAIVTLLLSAATFAAPSARILRIDPRTGQQSDSPVLTTVIEVAQSKRIGDQMRECATQRGNAQLDCMSNAMEKPFALYTPFPFPEKQALFMVNVDGSDHPAKLVSSAKWGDVQQTAGVGTAWLILVDADSRMGPALDDARQVARHFVESMGPNDIVNVMFFNDRQVVEDSKWVSAAQKSKAIGVIDAVTSTYPASGRNRSLLTLIKNAATDGFKALGNVGESINIPLHQAMVVLSSGFGGTDPSTTGPGAAQLAQYMTGGRFPEDNTALPKTPVPVISVYLPHKGLDEFRQNSLEFMQNLADPEIGGFFTVVQRGQGERAPNIVKAVRTRFASLYLVKWRVSCIAPTATQSFKLLFNNVQPPVLGDNSFKNVPIGIDPTTWPLDVDLQYSQDMAKRGDGVYPGGTFKVFGGFCWGGDKSRAEVYFIPRGQALPNELSGTDVEQAKRAQQQLIAMDMKGSALEANDSYVEFQAPDKEKILHGSGEQAVVRLVIFDNKARRTSGATNASVIEFKGASAPLPLLLILGGAFGLVVILLLIVVLVKSGGKKRGGPPPPAPVAAGGYGGPPGGGYGAPQGGYGPPPPGGQVAPAKDAPSAQFLWGSGGPGQLSYGVDPAYVVDFIPPNPYGVVETEDRRATLHGSAGVFTVLAGHELRAGTDQAQCGILLSEPEVAPVHASLKLEGGRLLVRDEHSGRGTLVNGQPLPAGSWSPVHSGALVRFGPVEFSAHIS